MTAARTADRLCTQLRLGGDARRRRSRRRARRPPAAGRRRTPTRMLRRRVAIYASRMSLQRTQLFQLSPMAQRRHDPLCSGCPNASPRDEGRPASAYAVDAALVMRALPAVAQGLLRRVRKGKKRTPFSTRTDRAGLLRLRGCPAQRAHGAAGRVLCRVRKGPALSDKAPKTGATCVLGGARLKISRGDASVLPMTLMNGAKDLDRVDVQQAHVRGHEGRS